MRWRSGSERRTRWALSPRSALALLVWAASVSTPARVGERLRPLREVRPRPSCSSDDARRAIVCLLNQRRDRAGLPDLRPDNKLDRAAQQHNRPHGWHGLLRPRLLRRKRPRPAAERVGYLGGGLTRWVYGENIAWGADWRGSPAAIVDAWMDSPPHRANILNRSFREIGIGFDTGTPDGDNAPGGIYTVDFGLRVD